MREVPMLFNTEMVKAILDDRKTQTRRLVKEIPLHAPYFEVVDGKPMACDENGDWYPATYFSRIQPGDMLWVRETWCHVKFGLGEWHYEYRADCSDPRRWSNGSFAEWRPSIHMPRAAARLFLPVKDVRIERLQHISIDDAIAEGCNAATPILQFQRIWDGTIKKSDLNRYGWEASPWVWVIEFEKVEK